MRRVVVLLLCAMLALPGCAAVTRPSAQRVTSQPNPSRRVDPALMADYVRQLPIGSRVKISQVGGTVIHGTLMKRDTDPIVVQRRTRLPEEPVMIPVRDILALELETEGSVGRTIAIGIASGAGATLGVLLLLIAVFSD
jgi:hypothetical protein